MNAARKIFVIFFEFIELFLIYFRDFRELIRLRFSIFKFVKFFHQEHDLIFLFPNLFFRLWTKIEEVVPFFMIVVKSLFYFSVEFFGFFLFLPEIIFLRGSGLFNFFTVFYFFDQLLLLLFGFFYFPLYIFQFFLVIIVFDWFLQNMVLIYDLLQRILKLRHHAFLLPHNLLN